MIKPMTIYTTNLKNAKTKKRAVRSAVENDIPAPEARNNNLVYVNVGGMVTAINA